MIRTEGYLCAKTKASEYNCVSYNDTPKNVGCLKRKKRTVWHSVLDIQPDIATVPMSRAIRSGDSVKAQF